MITRRRLLRFVALAVPGAIAVEATTTWAQTIRQPRRIGYLSGSSDANGVQRDNLDAFRAGMREIGYREGRDFVIESRFADGRFERYPALASELARANVEVVIAGGGLSATLAMRNTAPSIPVVGVFSVDPVGTGIAASYARPGGNVTGLTNIVDDVAPKQIELLRAFVPKLDRVAVLLGPASQRGGEVMVQTIDAAAKAAGISTFHAEANSREELRPALTLIGREHIRALIVTSTSLYNAEAPAIATLAINNGIGAMGAYSHYAEAGCLLSYGTTFAQSFRRVATYVDKLFKGAKAGDLPIERPTKLDLVINLRTAKALRLSVPRALLLQADKVIE